MSFPSAAEVVARFLRANSYEETLSQFLKEAQLPKDTGLKTDDDITLEQILQEKKTYDLSLNFEKLQVSSKNEWSVPAPISPTTIQSVSSKSNIISVSAELLVNSDEELAHPYAVVSTAARELYLVCLWNLESTRLLNVSRNAPILSTAVLYKRYFLCATMAGTVVVYDNAEGEVIETRQDHSKHVVKITYWTDDSSSYVATAGWDSKIFLYKSPFDDSTAFSLGTPFATIGLDSLPETILFHTHPELLLPILIVTRRDSTFLHYYSLPDDLPLEGHDPPLQLNPIGRQNLAPHSNAWVAFTPSAIQINPQDSSVIAVATSSIPHMKLMVVRMLLPHVAQEPPTEEESPNLARQAYNDLARQDREEAAIMISCNTLAPQTPYSTPALAWRPDGTGIFVNSDDGIIRGIEASTGKIIAKLEAHEPDSKIRCLWVGHIAQPSTATQNGEEWLISGGFDKNLIAWRRAELMAEG